METLSRCKLVLTEMKKAKTINGKKRKGYARDVHDDMQNVCFTLADTVSGAVNAGGPTPSCNILRRGKFVLYDKPQ
ncbi:conserved hypothetical protein [Ricinus communis]|uniref:Uncharacterized protein n=1 Tax=Ricinus communis TaxID=3988 RepID=B9SRR9_RICCO|nr:conserved hypothetical protein [Ricinus communis]